MKCPPMFVSIEFSPQKDEKGGSFTIWVPLFIIVPILLIIILALFLIALPFMILSFIFTRNIRWWYWLAMHVRAFFKIFHALLGLEIELADAGKEVCIVIH